MKTTIPDDLKAHLPPNLWGRVLGVTPVVMTVIATLLAGLATSEMTKAQYDRSLAAQQQSKAGDQWSFFQAKRLRGAIQSGTLDVVQSGPDERPIDADGLRTFAAKLTDPAPVQAALALLLAGRLPAQAAAPKPDPKVTAALEAIDRDQPAADLNLRLVDASPALVLAAIHLAQDQARSFDSLLRPIVTGGDRLGDELDPTGSAPRRLIHDFTVLRLRYSALRYDAEARLNQSIASLYELQVRQSNFSAERHERRSQRFFFGMLAAQAGVIVATLAMAARQRNLLWAIAAVAGLAAVAFAGYVFLFV